MFKSFKRKNKSVDRTCDVSEEKLYKELDKLDTETLEMLHAVICGDK